MEGSVIFRGKKISYSINGSGNTIVLLHGYLESKKIWNGFAAKLSKKFSVISIDLPGHGDSDVYSDIHTMEFMAAAIKSLLDELKIQKVFLTGHSLGGYVALAFLELYPESLSGYCLFHSQPFSDPPAALEKRKREIDVVKAGRKNLMYPDNVKKMFAVSNLERFGKALERSGQIASEISAEGIIAVLNGMMARPSRLIILEEGRVPLLWILGSMDNYIPLSITDRVKLPSNAEIVILQQSGHMGFIEEETNSLKAIESFIESRNL